MRRWVSALTLMVVAGACASDPETTLPAITRAGPAAAATATTTTPTSVPPSSTSTTAGSTSASAPPTAERLEERLDMVERQIAGRGVADPLVLEAMRAVPRHRFVTEGYRAHAYADSALPIGHGQTISQPYIVALMTEALGVEPGDRVLEIGTGSGYQAAVLAALGTEVYTIEIIPELAAAASAALEDLGYPATTRTADGYHGWVEFAPFDGIIVTAAPDHVPQPLVDQLGPGAALVIPVGPIGAVQTLWTFTVGDDGVLSGENLGPVRFVPFTRAED